MSKMQTMGDVCMRTYSAWSLVALVGCSGAGRSGVEGDDIREEITIHADVSFDDRERSAIESAAATWTDATGGWTTVRLSWTCASPCEPVTGAITLIREAREGAASGDDMLMSRRLSIAPGLSDVVLRKSALYVIAGAMDVTLARAGNSVSNPATGTELTADDLEMCRDAGRCSFGG